MKTSSTPTSPRGMRSRRLAAGIGAVAGGVALLLTPLGAGAQTDATAQAASAISVAFTPSGVTGECEPAATALLNNAVQVFPFSDATKFQLKIVTTKPLCESIEAVATVYKMPANGEQWPQQLMEQAPVVIPKDAGETLVTFTKACDRVQYDLVTGAVPAVLNSGFDHTLLFPGNLETAFQHVGNAPGCEQATSTTAAPTTTAATTTTIARVLDQTTVAPTTIARAVLAETEVPSSSSPAGLAATGGTSGPFALVGGGLVLIGVSFLLASRRRTV